MQILTYINKRDLIFSGAEYWQRPVTLTGITSTQPFLKTIPKNLTSYIQSSKTLTLSPWNMGWNPSCTEVNGKTFVDFCRTQMLLLSAKVPKPRVNNGTIIPYCNLVLRLPYTWRPKAWAFCLKSIQHMTGSISHLIVGQFQHCLGLKYNSILITNVSQGNSASQTMTK